MSVAAALEELRRHRGTQYDPRVLDVFLALVSEGKVDVAADSGRLTPAGGSAAVGSR
jgi:HD-GYP domain-containing protein (c-di-GMP phosphodiesterase class II)